MGWLTGRKVLEETRKGKIIISPFNEDQLNPNSYDYRLAPILRRLLPNSSRDGIDCIDPKLPMKCEDIIIPENGFLMKVEDAYLGHTVEKFGSDYYASLCTGKSSIGRLFIKNHACAGLIDQGFFGHITLEMTAKLPTIIYPNMRLGQIFWFESIGDIHLYNGKYSSDNAATLSKVLLDFVE